METALAQLQRGYRSNRFLDQVRPNVHEKQRWFLSINSLECLYGGAAGGGKSDAMLMAALQYVDVPGYAAIMFRRTYEDLSLPGALMDRAIQWLSKTDAKKVDGGKRWEFPGGGTLQFAYLDNPKDRFRYQGAEFQFVGMDEVSQIHPDAYKYLFSRLRRPSSTCPTCEGTGRINHRRYVCTVCNGSGINPLSNVPLRFRCASNPGGEYGESIKHAFITKKYLMSSEDYQFSRVWAKESDCQVCDGQKMISEDNVLVTCPICEGVGRMQRFFVPARLQDNPSVDQLSYRRGLAELPAQERAQLEHGRWDLVSEGVLFKAAWIRSYTWRGDHIVLHTEAGEKIIDGSLLWYFCTADTASSAKTTADYTVICTWAVLPNWGIALVDVVRERMEIPYIVPELVDMMEKWSSRFLIIEEASSGIAIVQQARYDQNFTHRTRGRVYLDYGKVVPFKPHGSDKVHRAQDA